MSMFRGHAPSIANGQNTGFVISNNSRQTAHTAGRGSAIGLPKIASMEQRRGNNNMVIPGTILSNIREENAQDGGKVQGAFLSTNKLAPWKMSGRNSSVVDMEE